MISKQMDDLMMWRRQILSGTLPGVCWNMTFQKDYNCNPINICDYLVFVGSHQATEAEGYSVD